MMVAATFVAWLFLMAATVIGVAGVVLFAKSYQPSFKAFWGNVTAFLHSLALVAVSGLLATVGVAAVLGAVQYATDDGPAPQPTESSWCDIFPEDEGC
jgi:hypothetical protein